jgi:protein TonB
VLRSVPLLDQAALDAVRQWRYSPSVYYGRAVSVLMTITVRFTLQQ